MSKTSMGTCPKCGSDNIEYITFDFPSDILAHECKCKKCGLQFYEYEALIYDGCYYEDEYGKSHYLDSKGNEF